jgi:hypothetical protein
VLEAAVRRAVQRLSQPTDATDCAQELANIERELARLAEALAACGGAVPALIEAVQAREAQRQELVARRARRLVPSLDPDEIVADLRGRLDEWRVLLDDNPSRARTLVKQLIIGRLDLTPNDDEGCYDFRGTGTVLPIIAGTMPGGASQRRHELPWHLPQSVASPAGCAAYTLAGTALRAA